MRLTHKAGDKLFVDYSGLTVPWVDRETAVINHAQIFVAVLGASNYTYIEATAEQSLPCWIESHIHAFEFYNGVTTCLVPDNLKAGVTKPHLYDPDTNLTYQEMANHYAMAIIPARVRAPKDKSKVEVGVQGIQRWILAPLRDVTFFSVADINEACLGILRMGKLYGTDRLENAAIRAIHIGAYRYKSIESILKNGLDQQPLPLPASETTAAVTATLHDNVRGAEYFH